MGKPMILSFSGVNRFLSNFWPATVEYEGIVYPTSEHAYQAAKTENEAERRFIAGCETPGDAKRHGASIKLRDGWDSRRVVAMERIVEAKFLGNAELGHRLIDTGDQFLLEGNRWHDQFWGSCSCGKRDACKGYGKNNLGQILMKVRKLLIQITQVDKEEGLDPKAIIQRMNDSHYGTTVRIGVCGSEVTRKDVVDKYYDPRGGLPPVFFDGRFMARTSVD